MFQINPSSYDSISSNALNQETISLLKQQMTKLKLISNELELKTQQYQLLKDTIQSLDEEKMAILEENQKLKTDIIAVIMHNQELEKIIKQNSQEVIKLNRDSQQYNQKIKTLSQQAQQFKNIIQDLQARNKILITDKDQINQKFKQFSAEYSQKQFSFQTLTKNSTQLKDTNKKLTTQISSVSTQLTSLTNDLTFSKQQYRLLKSKYQSIQSELEQRRKEISLSKKTIKQISEREENLLIVQEQFFQTQKIIEKMQKQLKKIEKQHINVQEQNIDLRKQKEKWKNIEHDLGILQRMADIGQVGQFLGEYTSRMQNIGSTIDSLSKDNQKLKKEMKKYQQEQYQLTFKLKTVQSKYLITEQQLSTIKSQHLIQISNVSQKYQSTIASTNLKCKTLQSLNEAHLQKIKQLAIKNQKLQSELNAHLQNINVIKGLKEENLQMRLSMEEMVEQCQESISTKKRINILKYAIANIIRHLFFAGRQIKNLLIFKQIIKNPCFMSTTIVKKSYDNLQKTNSVKKSKFKAAAQAIIFMMRIRKLLKDRISKSSFYLKDRILNKVINKSIGSTQNQINASFINQITNLLNNTSTNDVALSIDMLQIFEKNYNFQETSSVNFHKHKTSYEDKKQISKP